MSSENEQRLDTEAWHYTRWAFTRGRHGSLSLRRGRLSFATVADKARSSTFYEKVDDVAETIFDLVVDDIDAISYNWLVGALTVTQDGRRHIVSFAGPPSGNHFVDARRLVTALTTLGRWRAHLQLSEPAAATHRRTPPTHGE